VRGRPLVSSRLTPALPTECERTTPSLIVILKTKQTPKQLLVYRSFYVVHSLRIRGGTTIGAPVFRKQSGSRPRPAVHNLHDPHGGRPYLVSHGIPVAARRTACPRLSYSGMRITADRRVSRMVVPDRNTHLRTRTINDSQSKRSLPFGYEGTAIDTASLLSPWW
jgi:hypothetical protein